TFDPSRYGGTRATVLIPSQHLAGNESVDAVGNAEFRSEAPREQTGVLEPVGGAARPALENSPRVMESTSSFTGQIPMRRDAKPRPYPARAYTPGEPEPPQPQPPVQVP